LLKTPHNNNRLLEKARDAETARFALAFDPEHQFVSKGLDSKHVEERRTAAMALTVRQTHSPHFLKALRVRGRAEENGADFGSAWYAPYDKLRNFFEHADRRVSSLAHFLYGLDAPQEEALALAVNSREISGLRFLLEATFA